MKYLSRLLIESSKNILPPLASLIFESGCDIKSIKKEKEKNINKLNIEVFYNDNKAFLNFVNKLKEKKEAILSVTIINDFDEKLNNKLINISGFLPIETRDDYSTNVTGLREYAEEKIKSGKFIDKESEYYQSTALITGYKKSSEIKESEILCNYFSNQFDAIVLNRFLSKNAYPFVLSYDHNESLVQNLKSLEYGFSSFRLSETDEEYIFLIYREIIESIDKPILFKNYDEKVIFILSAILKLLDKNKYFIDDCNIGFVGIDSAVIRLSGILTSLGCKRVLGYDNIEKKMMFFEKEGGLATTRENIYSNCDIIIFNKGNISTEGLENLRPGLSIIANERLDCEDIIRNNKICRFYLCGNWYDHSLIFPYLIKIMEENKINNLNEKIIISISKFLASKVNVDSWFTDVFSDLKDEFEKVILNSYVAT